MQNGQTFQPEELRYEVYSDIKANPTTAAVKQLSAGVDAYFPILRGAVFLQKAMDHDNAERNMIATVEQVFRLIKTPRQDGYLNR